MILLPILKFSCRKFMGIFLLLATTHSVKMCNSLQMLLVFTAHYGHAKDLEISENAATFLVSKSLKVYAVILPKTMNYGILGHRKRDSNIPAAALYLRYIMLPLATAMCSNHYHT